MTNYNGFIFDDVGNLVSTPKDYTLDLLTEVYDVLIVKREYISASRINHLINVELNKD